MSQPATARGMEMRARLLAAAEKVFGERGYYRVGIVDITREAGTGTGTFYVYFVSKEAAFRELVQHLGHELRKATHLASGRGANRVEAERASFCFLGSSISCRCIFPNGIAGLARHRRIGGTAIDP